MRNTTNKKKRMAAKGPSGQTESADVPKHAGMASGTAFCLEYSPSEQLAFRR